MNTMQKIWGILFLVSIILTYPVFGQQTYTESQPRQVVLTWQNDPSTTMTITWRTDINEENHTLRFAETPDAESHDWTVLEANTFTFEETSAWLHTVELNNLDPGQKYYVEIEHPDFPDEFAFQTMPDENNRRELVFLAGGDSRTNRGIRRHMNWLAAQEDPDFVIFAGDLINDPLSEEDWDEWFDDWHEIMITSDGFRIPIIPAIGNHEVAGGYLQPAENAPFFLNRFLTPGPRHYYVLEMSPDLLLVTLDSDHIYPVEDQVNWLDSTLHQHENYKWKLAQYHVPAWRSVRPNDCYLSEKIREHWLPVFENYHLDYAIEAHDHAFKKTVPIRNMEQDDENGIVYLGDGGWGAPIRTPKNPDNYWYLAETSEEYHFWKLNLSQDGEDLQVNPVFRPVNHAGFVSQSVPKSMAPGEKANVSVTMKNTGSSSWTKETYHRLARLESLDSALNTTWGLKWVHLDDGETIEEGSEKTFTFEITAPALEGTFAFRWQMSQGDDEWFGVASANHHIIVSEDTIFPEESLGTFSLPEAEEPGDHLFLPYDVNEHLDFSSLIYTDNLNYNYNYANGFFMPYGWPEGEYDEDKYLEFTISPRGDAEYGISKISIRHKANAPMLGPEKVLVTASTDETFETVTNLTLKRDEFNVDHIYLSDLGGTEPITFRFHAYESMHNDEDQKDSWVIDNIEVFGTAAVTYRVTFDVRDKYGIPINNGLISLGEVENEEGEYIFEDMEPGTYNYEVKHDDYFTIAKEVEVVDEDVTENVEMKIDDTFADTPSHVELEIFPNPAHGLFFVESSRTIKQIQLIGIKGEVFKDIAVDDLQAEINVSNLHTGIYFMQIRTNAEVLTKPVQIAR